MINVTHTGVSNVQSYTYIIREMFLAKVATLDFFEGFHIRRTKLTQIQPEQLPQLAIYILPDEVMTPDGDPNAGEIRFVHQARLGFSVICLNNDEAQLEATLDAAFWAIMNGLWRDEYVMSFQDTWNPHTQMSNVDNVRVESITRGVRRHVYGAAVMNNELPVGEMQYEATVCYRTEWGAVVTDMLDEIYVKTNFPADHSGDPADVEQVQIVYLQPDQLPNGQTKGAPNGRDKHERPATPASPARQEGRPEAARGYPQGTAIRARPRSPGQ